MKNKFIARDSSNLLDVCDCTISTINMNQINIILIPLFLFVINTYSVKLRSTEPFPDVR